MFRGPQFWNWACPVRSLLQQRESHLPALSQYTAATALHGPKNIKRKKQTRCKQTDITPVCTSTFRGLSLHLDSRNIQPLFHLPPKAVFFSQHESADYLKAGHKQWKCSVVGSDGDCIVSSNCLLAQRKLWVVQQHCNSHCYLSQTNHLCSTPSFSRPFSSSVSTANILNHDLEPFGVHQTRCVHKAVQREESAWRDCLSGENEQRCRQILKPNLKLYEVEKVRRGPSLSLGKKQARWASVLVSLCCVEDEPAFLFTLRSSTLKGRHKGDVSFAGGKSDPSDKDVVATALREAREELGINVGADRVWGVLKPLREMSGMMIAPVLANLGPLEELSFKPNPGEVEEIFTLSLSHLCNPQNRGYTHFRTGDKYGYTLPVFRNGKHRVWGLTAVALDHTLKMICQQ